MKLEVAVVPVSDVDRAKRFYESLGWRMVAEVFHDMGGVFHHAASAGREAGPDPDHGDYASFASFSDPDGNGWVLQEVRTRAPGR